MTVSTRSAVRTALSAAGYSASVAALTAVWSHAAFAQTAESASASQTQLAEVLVTAQRRTESIQRVPIAISAFSSEQLEAASVATSTDLEHVTPNLIYGESGRDAQVFIRGVGSTRLSGAGADPSSSTYIDGVYRSRGTSALVELLDIQRVEVLRGPQGTLYGRNSTGGAVRFITEGPGKEFGGKVKAEWGNYDYRSTLGQVDIPLIGEDFLFRGSFLHSEHDGYTKNLNRPGETFGRKDLDAGRVTLKYAPSDAFQLVFHVGGSKDDSDQTALKHYIDPLGAFGSADMIADARTVRSDYSPRRAPVDNKYADLTVLWGVGSLQLTSVTGYVELDVGPYNGDLDVTEIAGITDGRNNLPLGIEDGGTSFTQELNLASSGNGPLQWVTGAFFLRDNNYTLRQGLYVPLVPSLAANHRTVNADAATTNYAAYGNVSYLLAESFRFNLGLRYSHEEKEIDRAQYVNLVLTTGPRHAEQSWSDWSPKVGVDYIISDAAMLYVSYSEGFKSGAFNASNFDPAVNPEYIDAYEAGVKTQWLNNRLLLNAALFQYDYSDLQVQTLDPNNIGTEIVRNAGGADIEGVEVEVTWLVTPSLLVNLNGAWLDATYTDFPTLAGNLRGNSLPNAPEWTANLGLQYTVGLGAAGELKFNSNLFASAERFLSETNNRINSYQSAYEMVDAQLNWTSQDGRLNIGLYGKNLTDEVVFSRTVTQAALLRTGYLAYIEPPRTYGVRLSVAF